MTEPVPFPLRPDEITPDWLNRALAPSLPGIEVGMAGTRRATDACADLDTLGAVRAAL